MLNYQLVNEKRLQHKKWLDELRNKGKPVQSGPPEPLLQPQVMWLWNGFATLSLQRVTSADGPHPISIADIRAYTSIMEFHKADSAYFMNMVVDLDRVFLEHQYKQLAQARKDASSKNKREGAKRRR